MSRPKTVEQDGAELQLTDVRHDKLAQNDLVQTDWTLEQHCHAVMDPFCAALHNPAPADVAMCRAKADQLCQPGSAFIRCLLGNQAYEGCGTVGFPAGCICAPQRLLVGDMPSTPGPPGPPGPPAASPPAGKQDHHQAQGQDPSHPGDQVAANHG